MKISNHSAVPVYTISGSSTARPLPEWLARKRKRSLKNDPEYANRIEVMGLMCNVRAQILMQTTAVARLRV